MDWGTAVIAFIVSYVLNTLPHVLGVGIIREVLNHCGVVELGSFDALVEVGPGYPIGLAVIGFKSCISGFQQLVNLTSHQRF